MLRGETRPESDLPETQGESKSQHRSFQITNKSMRMEKHWICLFEGAQRLRNLLPEVTKISPRFSITAFGTTLVETTKVLQSNNLPTRRHFLLTNLFP